MKIIKKLLLFLLLIVAVVLIIGLFLPKTYTVSVSETINKPKNVVFDYMKILKNQEKYSVWVMEDKNIKLDYTGVDGTAGAIIKWNSAIDNVGEGSQTITAITPDRMDVDLAFVRPMAGKAKAANIFKSISDNQTEVISEFYGESDPFPMTALSYFIGSYFIKDAETKSLANVKAILEK